MPRRKVNVSPHSGPGVGEGVACLSKARSGRRQDRTAVPGSLPGAGNPFAEVRMLR